MGNVTPRPVAHGVLYWRILYGAQELLRVVQVVLVHGVIGTMNVGDKEVLLGFDALYLRPMRLPQDACQTGRADQMQQEDQPSQRRLSPAPAPDFSGWTGGAGEDRLVA